MMKYSLFIFVITVILFSAGCSQDNALYVSPLGSDDNPGTEEAPFATLAKAQAAARNKEGALTIYLREGTYYLNEPIVFTPDDSRNGDSRNGEDHLTIQPFSGEKVVVSGAALLELKWQDYQDGIKQAKVDQEVVFDQLFVDGQLQRMARFPNYDPESSHFGGTSADAISVERAANWASPQGGYVHALHRHEWGDFHYVITGKDENGELQLEGGWQNNRQLGMHIEHRFVENIFEELDTVQEWFYESESQTLFFYPPAGLDLTNARIETPQIAHLFEFRGTEENPVTGITIKGIELTHTLRTFMETKEPLLRSDWTTYRGGTVLFEGAENCSIQDCYFNTVGGNAVYFSNYNRNNEVSGCHIAYAGASGVSFVGDPAAVRSPSFEYNEFVPLEALDKEPGPKNNNYPAQIQVYDNLMHDLGQVEKQIAGVQISMSQNITISHNTIYNVPRAGINISEGTWGGHMIEYNDVFNTVLETGDHGAFNSWGRDRFWHPDRATMDSITALHPEFILLDVVKLNTIRNNRFRCDHGWDIDLDDGSSNYHIYNNLCLNGGIKLREGFHRTVENNIMVNNSFHPHVWFENSGDVFTKNIVSTGYYPIRMPEVWGKEIDYNVFLDSLALAHSQQEGRDKHSVYSPSLFMDPANGDYRMQEGSPAFETGFENFPMDSFGVVSERLKSIAQEPPLPELIVLTASHTDAVIAFMGMQIKNLNTLGERSATGMDSNRGVLVIEVSQKSNLNGFIQPNDVILAFNGQKTDNMRELQEASMAARYRGTLEMQIFRNQKMQEISIPVK